MQGRALPRGRPGLQQDRLQALDGMNMGRPTERPDRCFWVRLDEGGAVQSVNPSLYSGSMQGRVSYLFRRSFFLSRREMNRLQHALNGNVASKKTEAQVLSEWAEIRQWIEASGKWPQKRAVDSLERRYANWVTYQGSSKASPPASVLKEMEALRVSLEVGTPPRRQPEGQGSTPRRRAREPAQEPSAKPDDPLPASASRAATPEARTPPRRR